MKRLASAFLKVQDNLSALREWEAQQDKKNGVDDDKDGIVKAAKRAAAGYKRRTLAKTNAK